MMGQIWYNFCQDLDITPAPKINMRTIRKMMSTTFRVQGASRELQNGLADLMAHSLYTADKQYDLQLGIHKSAEASAYIRASVLCLAEESEEESHRLGSDSDVGEDEVDEVTSPAMQGSAPPDSTAMPTATAMPGSPPPATHVQSSVVTGSTPTTTVQIKKHLKETVGARVFIPEENEKCYLACKPYILLKAKSMDSLFVGEVLKTINEAGPAFKFLLDKFDRRQLYNKVRHFVGRACRGDRKSVV
jgi:hypothetical protein